MSVVAGGDSPAETACPFCERIEARHFDSRIFGQLMIPVVSLAPLNPVTPGHRLFVPVRHVTDAGVSPALTGAVFEAAADYASLEWGEDGAFNLITSAGRSATQTVMHLHVHVVPRREGDGLTLPWTNQEVRRV